MDCATTISASPGLARFSLEARIMLPSKVPEVVFHTRVRNDALGGPNPFEWKDTTSSEIFGGKRVVLFAVPGAFTPACSDSHLPGAEPEAHPRFVIARQQRTG